MQETLEPTDEISICFCFVDGNSFTQPLTFDELDAVESLMSWFRDPKGGPVWTWHVPTTQKVHMLHRIHIMAIDINGYIAPDGHESRWYHRLLDRMRTHWMLWRMKGGEVHESKADTDTTEAQTEEFEHELGRDDEPQVSDHGK